MQLTISKLCEVNKLTVNVAGSQEIQNRAAGRKLEWHFICQISLGLQTAMFEKLMGKLYYELWVTWIVSTCSLHMLWYSQFTRYIHRNPYSTLVFVLFFVQNSTDMANYRIFSNLIRTSFCRFLKRKKLIWGSNPYLSFNRPLPTRQTDRWTFW
jgi:hypothetical protein